MKIPLNWLKDYVDIEISQDELVKRLTAIGHMQDKKPEHVAGDTVIDLEVRQNRSDCLSILGVAQEVAAVTGKRIKACRQVGLKAKTNSSLLNIINESPENCFRFSAYKIAGIDPEANTPDWMKARLEAYGMKTISPIVDITNFVMIETGEPMHAFDSRSIPNGVIKLRQAKKGEKLTVLGDKSIELDADDLIVTDKDDSPISFSGLIGGTTSGIKSDSTEIVLEAATYNQAVVRRSSIRHSIRTEASTRHEKFMHTDLVIPALDRAASLIMEICGGEVVAFHENIAKRSDILTLELRFSEVARLGGVEIDAKEVIEIFQNLNFEILEKNNLSLKLRVPYVRTDILEEADLVEEVLRIYGYENIPGSLPNFAPPKRITSKYFLTEEKIRDAAVSIGLSEIITEPLVAPLDVDEKIAIHLQNALNADKSVLRTSLKSGLVGSYKYQRKFDKSAINVFEIGLVYHKANTKKNPYLEIKTLGVLSHDSTSVFQQVASKLLGFVKKIESMTGCIEVSEELIIGKIDEHTAFTELAIRVPTTASNAEGYFYESIPHFSEIDISVSLKNDIDLVKVSYDLQLPETTLEDVSWTENADLAPSGYKYALFKLKFRDLKYSKSEIISQLTDMLKKKYSAEIR